MPTPETRSDVQIQGRPDLSCSRSVTPFGRRSVCRAGGSPPSDGRLKLRKYVRSHPRCVAVQIEAKEKIKDLAESQLVQLLNAKDGRAVQFTLLTLARDRAINCPKALR
jgi:hypothetical protein